MRARSRLSGLTGTVHLVRINRDLMLAEGSYVIVEEDDLYPTSADLVANALEVVDAPATRELALLEKRAPVAVPAPIAEEKGRPRPRSGFRNDAPIDPRRGNSRRILAILAPLTRLRLTAREISKRAKLNPNSVSSALFYLARDGYVNRTGAKFRYRYAASPRGREIAERAATPSPPPPRRRRRPNSAAPQLELTP